MKMQGEKKAAGGRVLEGVYNCREVTCNGNHHASKHALDMPACMRASMRTHIPPARKNLHAFHFQCNLAGGEVEILWGQADLASWKPRTVSAATEMSTCSGPWCLLASGSNLALRFIYSKAPLRQFIAAVDLCLTTCITGTSNCLPRLIAEVVSDNYLAGR